jgi:hypothetical protein
VRLYFDFSRRHCILRVAASSNQAIKNAATRHYREIFLSILIFYQLSAIHPTNLHHRLAQGGGNGPGGTARMYNAVMRRIGQATWIDTQKS